ERVCAVAFRNVQARETARKLRDATARGLYFDGNRYGVAVVLDEVNQRKFLRARRVQGFPEFAFAGRAVASGDKNDFVRFVADILAEWRLLGLCQGFWTPFVIQRGFRSAHGLHKLRAGAGGLVDDVQAGMAPMRRHLAAARAGIVFGADSLEQHLDELNAKHQAEGTVAIVGID